jgi:hypothetical protein
MSETMNADVPTATQSGASGGISNSNAASATKTKASILAEQSAAIVDMAADFKTTVQSRKPYLEAKMVGIRLANLKELRDLGIIEDDEFKEEARKLI